MEGATMKIERLCKRDDPQRLPEPLAGDDEGFYVIDSCWGVVQPMTLAPGVETVGELEVVEHIESGGAVVDSRLTRFLKGGMVPGALSVPHPETLDRRDLFDPDAKTVLYCNGPQCPASPQAIEALLEAGQPAESLLYYRGGILDWVACGYPLVPVTGG
jgi:rhodanese-related sulfurtransferase